MALNWGGDRPSQVPAEILPPETRDDPRSYGRMPGYDGDSGPIRPGPPRPARGNRWASAPATYTLVGINCAVYLAMVLRGVSPSNPTVAELVHWGANFGVYVLERGQWWRLLTAAFVHIGILHLATNMWCLWNLGLLGEPLLGPAGVIAVYGLTGIAGNLLSIRRLSVPALPARSSGSQACSFCCSKRNCCRCRRRRFAACAGA
jgi:membrane associated rhomboid family serine protease